MPEGSDRLFESLPCTKSTELFRAIADYSPSDITSLIAAGTPMNVSNEDGVTPLHIAAHLSVASNAIEMLLKAGAEPDACDNDGNTALHFAVNSSANESGEERTKVIKSLIAAGASPNFRNKDGNTPLHSLATNSSVRYGGERARILLEHEADVFCTNVKGAKPKDCCSGKNDVYGLINKAMKELPYSDDIGRSLRSLETTFGISLPSARGSGSASNPVEKVAQLKHVGSHGIQDDELPLDIRTIPTYELGVWLSSIMYRPSHRFTLNIIVKDLAYAFALTRQGLQESSGLSLNQVEEVLSTRLLAVCVSCGGGIDGRRMAAMAGKTQIRNSPTETWRLLSASSKSACPNCAGSSFRLMWLGCR